MDLNKIGVALAITKKKNVWLARKLEVSTNTVSMWVNNKKQPTIKRLFEISIALDVSVCSLLEDQQRVKDQL